MAEKLDNIITLAGKFKDSVELKEYCNKQFSTIAELNRKVALLEEQNLHLKTLLEQAASSHTKESPIVSTEQAICEVQLKKLREIAFERELTLEETKKLDLLVKNLNLAKGDSTQIINAQYKKLENVITDAQLIQIASKSDG